MRLLADVYHLANNGEDLGALANHVGRIGHVQIADAPGRHEPGTGELDIDGVLWSLEPAGYRGWVGLEYRPAVTSASSFEWVPRSRRGNGETQR